MKAPLFPRHGARRRRDAKDAYTMEKSRRLRRRRGIHWIYAPDADVNNNPGNPIINTRSFAKIQSALRNSSARFARRPGKRRPGNRQTFSGHGDTAADSH